MKTKIVQKSTKLFLNLGFKSVTMDDIAEKLAISKKTIYAHFANKEALVEATAFYIFDQISTLIEKIENEKINPIEETFKIKEVVSHYLKGEKTSPEFQLKKYYPSIYAKLDLKKRNIINTCFKDNLQRGIKDGFFRNDINVNLISKFYYLAITAIKNDALFFEDNINEAMEYYLEYHIRAIATEKGLKTLNKILIK
ncbi:MAG: TetR/AcrR family transcriptional regulator [Flavobacteriaceae bacterium]|nr:TetR/AcrR family transcriptional regulator [Flavobacteriaceae bacterium]